MVNIISARTGKIKSFLNYCFWVIFYMKKKKKRQVSVLSGMLHAPMTKPHLARPKYVELN